VHVSSPMSKLTAPDDEETAARGFLVSRRRSHFS
jgi:hypothetical protein